MRENFSDLHPPLDRHEALVEADRCYFCHDAPCMHGLPDLDRHSAVHPRDLDRQSARRGQDDLRPEHSRRHVRPRLPDRDAVRRGLRARGRRGQAGEDRPAAALCHRHRDGARASSSTNAPRRPARRSPSSAPGLRALPAPTGSPCTAMTSIVLRRARQRPAASTNTASPPTRRRDDFAQAEVDYVLSIGGIDDRDRQGARPRRDAWPNSPPTMTRSSSASALPASTRSAPRARMPTACDDAVDFIAEPAPGRRPVDGCRSGGASS